MNLHICAIYDTASQLFGRPFFVAATGQATRSFRDEINKPDTEFGRHPDDYSLYHFGTFDDNDGSWNLHSHPVLLVRGKDVVEIK